MKRSAWLVAVGLLLATAPAHAGRCHRASMPPRMPIGLSLGPREFGMPYADFGSTPSACAITGFDVSLRGTALISNSLMDQPNLYGALAGEVVLRGAYAFNDTVWLTGSIALLEYREVHNATVIARDVGVGPATLAAHVVVARGEDWQLAPYVRALVFGGEQYGYGLGIEPGISGIYVPINRLSFHGSVSFPISSTFTDPPFGGRTTPIALARVAIETAYTPVTWFEIALGIEARFGLLPDDPLESIAPSAALRFLPGHTGRIELAALAPVAGTDNTTARFALTAGSYW